MIVESLPVGRFVASIERGDAGEPVVLGSVGVQVHPDVLREATIQVVEDPPAAEAPADDE
jgi:hypothetical protein